MTNVQPSYTELRKALQDGLTNPKKDKRARILLSSGNPDYFLQRAMEELEQALESLRMGEGPDNRADLMNNAILLLAGAKAVDGRTPI